MAAAAVMLVVCALDSGVPWQTVVLSLNTVVVHRYAFRCAYAFVCVCV